MHAPTGSSRNGQSCFWTGLFTLAFLCGMNAADVVVESGSPAKSTNSPPPSRQPDKPLPLRQLFDTPLRDTAICRGPDGLWYLTGTVAPFWAYNEGICVWKSKDLLTWEALGMVWKYGSSPWHAKYLEAKKPLWAPEIHFLKGTFWLTYSMPGWDGTAKTSGSGLLKSTSGKPEGPYQDMQPDARLGDVFKDETGQWWSTYFGSDAKAPWQERPGVLPVVFDAEGRLSPKYP